jgi:NADH-quinone oxidoreductase subunit D
MRHRFKEYNDLFSYNEAFLGRARGLSQISNLTGLQYALTGPNARASGLRFDVRKGFPYAAYEKIDFDVLVGGPGEGDAHGRYMMRIREIVQSMDIIRQCAEAIPKGEYLGMRADQKISVPQGKGVSRVEGPRGMIVSSVFSNEGERPTRVHFRSPSRSALSAVPKVLRGVLLEDIPLVLASLDLSIAELDR